EKVSAADSSRPRIGPELASAYLAFGEASRMANRPAEAVRALRSAADILTKTTAADPKSLAADWLELTVSQGWLGEKDQARKACRKAAKLLMPSAANAALRPLIRKAAMVVGLESPEADQLLVAAAGEPPLALTDAIHQSPDQGNQAVGYNVRSNWYA